MSRFVDSLTITEISDSIFAVSDHPFRYESDLIGLVTVPVGFSTDFASVPRFLPLVYACLGDTAHQPAVIHDWLYFSALTTREVADNVLLEAMKVLNVPAWRRYPIFLGVRIGGWKAWHDHRKAGHPKDGKFSSSLIDNQISQTPPVP